MWRISFRYIIVHTKIFVFRYLMSACQGFVAFFLLWTNSIITFCYHPKLTPFYTQFPFQFIWTCRIFYLISIIFCACMSICQIYICEQSFILNKTVFFFHSARQPRVSRLQSLREIKLLHFLKSTESPNLAKIWQFLFSTKFQSIQMGVNLKPAF